MHGKASPADYRVPEGLSRALNLAAPEMYSPITKLSHAKDAGVLGLIPEMADKAAAALAPIGQDVLLDRLTLLGMAMIRGLSDPERKAWLHETARLLSDLPERILLEAIDDCVKEPGRVFAPSVGEILDKASVPLTRAEREAANLRKLANLIAGGVEIPDLERPRYLDPPGGPKEPWKPKPGETEAILAEFPGLKGSAMGEKIAGMLAPDKPKTRADYIAAGEVPPPIIPREPDPWAMMP